MPPRWGFWENHWMTDKKNSPWDFPGSPVVKTLPFQYTGHGFNLWLGNYNPTCHMPWSKFFFNFLKREKGLTWSMPFALAPLSFFPSRTWTWGLEVEQASCDHEAMIQVQESMRRKWDPWWLPGAAASALKLLLPSHSVGEKKSLSF